MHLNSCSDLNEKQIAKRQRSVLFEMFGKCFYKHFRKKTNNAMFFFLLLLPSVFKGPARKTLLCVLRFVKPKKKESSKTC